MALGISKEGFWIRAGPTQKINGWKGILPAKSASSMLHSEHKSCALCPVKWNMKGCKTSTRKHTNTQTHTLSHMRTHTEADFSLQFVFTDYAVFF